MQKLSPWAAGLALGIFWGVMLFLGTLLSLWTGYAYEVLELIGKVYPGYSVSLVGSLVVLAYGLVDAFIAGFIGAGCIIGLRVTLLNPLIN